MFEGKSSRRKIDASKEKGSKKEETLSRREKISRIGFERPLEERHSRGFLLSARRPCPARSIMLETVERVRLSIRSELDEYPD